jgi:hypothetical protein
MSLDHTVGLIASSISECSISVASTLPSSMLGLYFGIRGVDGVFRVFSSGQKNVSLKNTSIVAVEVSDRNEIFREF